jgi:hypothetical protein
VDPDPDPGGPKTCGSGGSGFGSGSATLFNRYSVTFGLLLQAHVYKVNEALYSVVLGVVNVQTGMNSYYKLQVLQHDKKPKYVINNYIFIQCYTAEISKPCLLAVLRSRSRVPRSLNYIASLPRAGVEITIPAPAPFYLP